MGNNLYRGNSDTNPQVTRAGGTVTVAINSVTAGRRSYSVSERTGRIVDTSVQRLTRADLHVIEAALDGSGLSRLRVKMRSFHAADFD